MQCWGRLEQGFSNWVIFSIRNRAEEWQQHHNHPNLLAAGYRTVLGELTAACPSIQGIGETHWPLCRPLHVSEALEKIVPHFWYAITKLEVGRNLSKNFSDTWGALQVGLCGSPTQMLGQAAASCCSRPSVPDHSTADSDMIMAITLLPFLPPHKYVDQFLNSQSLRTSGLEQELN